MSDPFETAEVERHSPYLDGAAVTPDDDNDLPTAARGLYIGTAGNVRITTLDGTVLTIPNHPVGYLLWGARRVHETGTTASNIIAGW